MSKHVCNAWCNLSTATHAVTWIDYKNQPFSSVATHYEAYDRNYCVSHVRLAHEYELSLAYAMTSGNWVTHGGETFRRPAYADIQQTHAVYLLHVYHREVTRAKPDSYD